MTFARLVQFLLEKCTGQFFGTVTLSFRRGAIVTVRCEETYDLQHEAAKLPVKDEQAVLALTTGRWPQVPAAT